MITTQDELAEWRKRAREQQVARTVLDLEADSLHRHKERLCLIQYADAEGVEIIDPLCIEDMRLFSQWMSESEIWMHGADYDMNLLQSAYGVLPVLILDTQVAARLLGYRQFGLAGLVESLFDVVLSKKNQKADWGKRPISPTMEEYAKADVAYILPMADLFIKELHEKGRYEWFIECCQNNMDKARKRFNSPEGDPWRIKGSGRLNPRGLAALRSLWTWRDKEAAAWDRPAFMVCSNDELIQWSNALQQFRSVSPRKSFHQQRSMRFHKAVEQFQAIDEEDYPTRAPRKARIHDDQFEEKLAALIAQREVVAEELGIEGSFIASRSQLEVVALAPEEGWAQLMNWQRKLLQPTS